jgi:hypothetical protein
MITLRSPGIAVSATTGHAVSQETHGPLHGLAAFFHPARNRATQGFQKPSGEMGRTMSALIVEPREGKRLGGALSSKRSPRRLSAFRGHLATTRRGPDAEPIMKSGGSR